MFTESPEVDLSGLSQAVVWGGSITIGQCFGLHTCKEHTLTPIEKRQSDIKVVKSADKFATRMDAREAKTPEVLPWIPPGRPQDESPNKFAHKKGSIASRLNAEVTRGLASAFLMNCY